MNANYPTLSKMAAITNGDYKHQITQTLSLYLKYIILYFWKFLFFLKICIDKFAYNWQCKKLQRFIWIPYNITCISNHNVLCLIYDENYITWHVYRLSCKAFTIILVKFIVKRFGIHWIIWSNSFFFFFSNKFSASTRHRKIGKSK